MAGGEKEEARSGRKRPLDIRGGLAKRQAFFRPATETRGCPPLGSAETHWKSYFAIGRVAGVFWASGVCVVSVVQAGGGPHPTFPLVQEADSKWPLLASSFSPPAMLFSGRRTFRSFDLDSFSSSFWPLEVQLDGRYCTG